MRRLRRRACWPLDPSANVIVLGDLNDFYFSAPLAILKGGRPDRSDRDAARRTSATPTSSTATPRTLDHILVSPSLLNGGGIVYDVVHVNAEFADQASDHDPQVARFTLQGAADADPDGHRHADDDRYSDGDGRADGHRYADARRHGDSFPDGDGHLHGHPQPYPRRDGHPQPYPRRRRPPPALPPPRRRRPWASRR